MILNEFKPKPEQQELYYSVCDDVESRAERIAMEPYGGYVTGICHLVWAEMKDIYKNEYNIDWLSPEDLNPGCFFD